jgi:transcription termination factor Rho
LDQFWNIKIVPAFNIGQASETKVEDDKPKRARIVPVKKAAIQNTNSSLFSNEQVALDTAQAKIEEMQMVTLRLNL